MASAETNKVADAVSADPDIVAGEGVDTAAPARRSRKKFVIIVIAAALLLLGGGGGAAWYFLWRTPAGAKETAQAEPITAEEMVDIAEMTVNLRTSDSAAKTLRVHLMLVPGEKKKEAITAALPLVIDAFQPFLRELRPEDIAGSAATFRIKEEMLVRANAVLGAGAVRDVLIQDLVQQ